MNMMTDDEPLPLPAELQGAATRTMRPPFVNIL